AESKTTAQSRAGHPTYDSAATANPNMCGFMPIPHPNHRDSTEIVAPTAAFRPVADGSRDSSRGRIAVIRAAVAVDERGESACAGRCLRFGCRGAVGLARDRSRLAGALDAIRRRSSTHPLRTPAHGRAASLCARYRAVPARTRL